LSLDILNFVPVTDLTYYNKLHVFFLALWVHLMFWTSFVLHSQLTNCDCLWFTEGLFWPLQIRKTFLFEWHWFQCYATYHQKSASRDASCSETWRLESISQMHQPYVVMLLTWRHTWTTWTLTVPSVVRFSKAPHQWL
jgi:hypothetical protein